MVVVVTVFVVVFVLRGVCVAVVFAGSVVLLLVAVSGAHG
jgi:hypothetical protein